MNQPAATIDPPMPEKNNPSADVPSRSDPLDEIVAQYIRGIESGENPSRDELLARHPALVDELREFFADHDRMNRLAAPLCEPTLVSPAVLVADRVGYFGDYEVLEEIARGGMGAVFKARDPAIGREVAIKVLLERHEGQPEAVRRFVDEAQIGGRLQHPGIAPVYELGRFDDRRPYFTMKLVQGQTLATLLAKRPEARGHAEPEMKQTHADLPRYLAIFEQVCQTLAYAHARGVIHRDLKPSNVMVGAFGEVQVMDWGLAKVLAGSGRDAGTGTRLPSGEMNTERCSELDTPAAGASQTRTGSVLGTPAYMAPEQARGDNALVDQRADVFGLGAILCVLLTGEPPFTGPAAEAQLKSETASLAAAFERLDACGADGELISLAMRCLAADPRDRPQTAGVVADQLTAHLHSVSVRLRKAELASVEADVKAAEERKRRRLTGAWAATAVLAVALIGTAWLSLERERDAKVSRATQDVNDALNRAVALRERAIVANVADVALWVEAREQAQRAKALAESGAVDPALTEKVRQLIEMLGDEERDRQLLAALNAARLVQAEPELLTNRFALERAAPLLRDALSTYGLAVGAGAPQAAAAKIRARPDVIRDAIITAMDDWIWLVEQPAFKIDEPHLNWLREVLKQADADEWRQQMRLALAIPDPARRLAALIELAERPDLERQPPLVLTVLANWLTTNRDFPRAVKLLLRAQRRYPDDFFVNELLALALLETVPPQPQEAVRFASVAVALRPESAGALLNLGQAFAGAGRHEDEIAALHRAVELKPDYPGARCNLGSSLCREGRYADALDELRMAIELLPEYANAHDSLGGTLFKLGRIDEAITAYRRSISLGPCIGTYNNLGNVLSFHGAIDEAIEAYDAAIALNPNDPLAHTSRGVALAAQGKHDEALAAHLRAIEVQPLFAKAHANLGSMLKRMGRRGEALAAFRTAIEVNAKQHEAHSNLGDMLIEDHKLDEALSLFRRFVDDNPGDARGWYRLGRPLWLQGNLDEAIGVYRRAIELDPRFVEAYSHLGLVFEEQSRPDEAIAVFRQGIEIRPDYAEIRSNLGQTLCRQGKFDEGIDEFRKAIELSPKLVQPQNGLGLALLTQRRCSEAIPVLRRAVELQPDRAEGFCQLGEALYVESQLKEAVAAYRRALELGAENASIWIGLANSLLRLNQLDEAQTSYRRTLELQPDSAEAHCDLGNVLVRLGRPDEAIQSCRQAIKLKPNLVNAHTHLGAALDAIGNPGEALGAYRRATELDPQNASAWYKVANSLLRQNVLDEADTAYRRTIELKPDYAEAHCDLGSVLRFRGLIPEAIESYRQAIAVKPDLAEAHANLAEMLRLQNRLEEAAEEVSQAIDLGPNFAEAHVCLGRVRADQNRFVEAEGAYRRAIELKPSFVRPHIDLGILLMRQARIDEAIEVHRRLVKLSPEYAEGLCNLGQLLQQRGDFVEALAAFQRAHELGSRRRDWPYPTAQWVAAVERLASLDANLTAVLAGQVMPADAAERIDLAGICLDYKRKYLAAARWFTEAFAMSPELAEDLGAGRRYRAARAAAQAADGKGDDAGQLDAPERARWRKQAIDWLNGDLVLWGKQLESSPPESHTIIRQALRNWQQDAAFASLHNRAQVAEFPMAEQEMCRKLWADIDTLLARIGARD